MIERLRDLPMFPRFKDAWDDRAIKSLDEWVTAMREYLLVRPIDSTLELDFRAPDLPSKKTDLQVQPIGVWPIAFYRVDSAGPVSAAMTNPFQWAWASGTLTFPSLSGISGTDTYRLRVIVREARRG